MNLSSLTPNNFLASTATAYMLLLIGILLLANLFFRSGPSSSSSSRKTK